MSLRPSNKTRRATRLALLILCGAVLIYRLMSPLHGAEAARFTLMTYNVENLFDVDGRAEFSDYRQTQKPDSPYSARKLLTKLEHIHRVVASVNDGAGPEVLMLQEIETDLSPSHYHLSPEEAAMRLSGERPLREILLSGKWRDVADLPAELLLWRYFEENGLPGYQLAVAAAANPKDPEPTPHTNAVFSRFPIQSNRAVNLHQARDLQIVEIRVGETPVTLLNMHFKSGASDPETEPLRLDNARQAVREVQQILKTGPLSDVILAGDFNTSYNTPLRFPEWARNRKQPSKAVYAIEQFAPFDSLRQLQKGGATFYNLWFELPAEKRHNETFRGRWNTLVHLLITPGLVDQRGISYIPGTFRVHRLPGINANEYTEVPFRWITRGPVGAGYSDHLPLTADFQINGPAASTGVKWLPLPDAAAEPPFRGERFVDYRGVPTSGLPDAASRLRNASEAKIADEVGRFFEVETTISHLSGGRPYVKFGPRSYELFAFNDRIRTLLKSMKKGQRIHAIGELKSFDGELEFIIRRYEWMFEPTVPRE